MGGERAMIFIDGSNFYHNLKNNRFNPKIDFKKFSDLLCGDRKYVRSYYYNTPLKQEEDPAAYRKQQAFLDALRRTPYLELKLGYFLKKTKVCSNCSSVLNYPVEKGCDVTLAVDMMSMAYKNLYDVGILVSSDGDFASACQCVKDLGKHIENAYFENGSSWHLLNVCDDRILINQDLIEKCKM
jgi:6-hydroxy-3-succinoylpyridine 3-monooxygenase